MTDKVKCDLGKETSQLHYWKVKKGEGMIVFSKVMQNLPIVVDV